MSHKPDKDGNENGEERDPENRPRPVLPEEPIGEVAGPRRAGCLSSNYRTIGGLASDGTVKIVTRTPRANG